MAATLQSQMMLGPAIFLSSFAMLTMNKWFRRFNKPRLRYADNEQITQMIQNCSNLSSYSPPPLLDWWGHVHTVLNHLVRQKKAVLHHATREILQLEDGGTVALDWLTTKPEMNSTRPIVILIHGLCMSLSSPSHLQ
jgi:predicted alpha/beta-fold hydrolase